MASQDVAIQGAGQHTSEPSDGGAATLFAEAVAIMARLRGPGGCSWDREQTPESIRKHTIEEAYEVLDAIERRHAADLCEELGDLLLQVLFYAQMAAEAGDFSISDVVAGLNRKLIRRHPHVFGAAASAAAGNRAVLPADAAGIESKQVLQNWNAIKQMEKKVHAAGGVQRPSQTLSRLQPVLRAQSALIEAQKLGSAAARAGFDWPEPQGLLAKIREEVAEVEAEMDQVEAATMEGSPPGEPASPALQLEVGDLLFATANLARHLHVDPEMALRDASAKFRSRFAAMERFESQDGGPPLEQRSLDDLEALWQQAKQAERSGVPAPLTGPSTGRP